MGKESFTSGARGGGGMRVSAPAPARASSFESRPPVTTMTRPSFGEFKSPAPKIGITEQKMAPGFGLSKDVGGRRISGFDRKSFSPLKIDGKMSLDRKIAKKDMQFGKSLYTRPPA